MPSFTLSLVLGAIPIYLCYHVFQTYNRLSNIPGPFWAKITNVQRVYWVKSGNSHTIHEEVHKKHGDLARLGPNMVSVSNPAFIPAVYPMRPGFIKSKFYDAFMPYIKGGALPAIFTTQDEQQHKQLKTPVAPLYNMSNVATFETFVNDTIDVLVKQMDKRFVGNGVKFDLGDWLQFFAFEVMGTMTFSKRYGLLETGVDERGMLNAIWDFMLTIAPMTQIPWFDKLWYKNQYAASLRSPNASPILKIVADATAERKAALASTGEEKNEALTKTDFLAKFLEIQSSNPNVPPFAATAWTFSNVIAGSDSTAAVMKTVWYNILAHPKTLAKVYAELEVAKQNKTISLPYGTWQELNQLSFLDACVQEAVRLHPPFCLPFERIVPSGGIEIAGKFLPEGTVVGMNPYVVNRHVPTFGKDVDTWRPERWCGLTEEEHRKMEASVMTFGAGRRVCLGKYVAILEIKKVTLALLLNYDFNLINKADFVVENSYFFRQRGINVTATKRADAPLKF